MISAPSSIDHRGDLSGVLWQGNRETCLALAATAGHELLRKPQRLSPEYLYWAALKYCGGPVGALPMSSVVTALGQDGQCEETMWPYNPSAQASRSHVPAQGIVADAITRLIPGARELPRPDTASARQALANGLAVVLGVGLTESLYETLRDGTIPPPEGEPTGGHAVLLAGYDDGRAALLVRNSWGTRWGVDGYGWLPYDYPKTYLWRLLTFQL